MRQPWPLFRSILRKLLSTPRLARIVARRLEHRGLGRGSPRGSFILFLDQPVEAIFGAEILQKIVSALFLVPILPGKLTGMPELVLMPAPVTTTTFLALTSAFAMSWRDTALSGWTSRVGISGRS